MAEIAALRGVRYTDKAGPLEKLVAPPYDVISPDEQRRLHDLSPHNVVRLILNAEQPKDHEIHNRYTRAAESLDAWLADGVLAFDPTPAIYACDHEFEWAGRRLRRRGLLSLVKLEELGRGSVLPHEYTMPGPKADRLKLMSACQGCLSPIFALYPDEDKALANTLDSLVADADARGAQAAEVQCAGERHTLLPLTGPQAIERLKRLMAPKPLFIADGHHRYETAWAYRARRLQERGRAGAADYVLMMSVAMNDPGLLILPTHRALRNVDRLSPERLRSACKRFFEVEEVPAQPVRSAQLAAHPRRCQGAQQPTAVSSPPCAAGLHAIFAYFGKDRGCLSLRLLDEELAVQPGSGMSRTWHQLDVNILRNLIFSEILGLDVDTLAQGPDIAYVHDAREAMRLVDEESWDAAFLLEPTGIDELKQVALAGERMPPKSTYFHPKLLTGLALYLFREPPA